MTCEPKFRALTADDVECRIANISKKGNGLSLLLYKTARCDMKILDETVGPMNWQRKHSENKGNAYCAIGINRNYKDENAPAEWVWKEDCGSESYTDKEKGEASDAFKRAGFNWGIGRELYTSPFIWITDCDIKQENGKFVCHDKFVVTSLEVTDGAITGLTIFNQSKRCVCFQLKGKSEIQQKMLSSDIDRLVNLAKSKGVSEDRLLKKYKIKELWDISPEDYEKCVEGLTNMSDV